MFRKWLNAVGIALLLTIVALAMSQAGPLEPSAPPGPTMKTLDEIPPTWSQILPDERRYVLALEGAGVLDKETGLVWERGPKFVLDPQGFSWASAFTYCVTKTTGSGPSHRGGWRLPSIEERASLGFGGEVFLSDSPFDGDCSDGSCLADVFYWTSTTSQSDPNQAWTASGRGNLGTVQKANIHSAWCVRGSVGGR
jgi:hypothetical protein